MERESLLTLDIEKPAVGGRMLARHDRRVVLVWGAIPGERVTARVEREQKGVVYAETVDVLSCAADRRDAPADWRCGGNVYAHIAYPRQLQLKSEIIRDAFVRIGRIPLVVAPEVIGSTESGYRMRARLHVRHRRIGFFREGSHDVCDPASTAQLLPETVAWLHTAAQRLTDVLDAVTDVELAENVPATERVCHFELRGACDPRAFLAAFSGLTGLTASRPQTAHVDRLAGIPTLTDLVLVSGGSPAVALRLRHNVRAFFQANRYLLERLVRHVVSLVPDGPVVDLYAGVGLFGLSLAAERMTRASLVEGDPISGGDLEENATPFRAHTRVHRCGVEAFLRTVDVDRTATFIVDPPRTGLSRDATRRIVDLAPPMIVYISCDPATLARDARAFVDAGWELNGVTGFDLFPNTAHVESVAVMSRTN
jgi:23S rRNA (uracil1939-C5)-methyltransferase